MIGQSIVENRPAADPTLKDLLNLFGKNLSEKINCHAIGTIQSFNPALQTVVVKINYQRVYLEANEEGIYEYTPIDYPLLLDVPAVILQGGNGSLTFPITSGDTCLVLFNDRDIDNWWTTGKTMAVASLRSHAFSDAMALIGLRSSLNPLTNYDSLRAVLQLGSTKVCLGASQIELNNASNISLGTILGNLMTQLSGIVNALTTINTACSNPVPPSTLLNISNVLTTITNELSGLLK